MPKGGQPVSSDSERESPNPEPDFDWYNSFLRQGLSPQAATTAAGYISKGIDPAIALHITFGLGLDKAPESQWETFAREQPIRANTKKLLNISGSNLKEFARPVTDSLPNPAHEQEKLSAAKMLKDYLMHQDMQRAEEAKKESLWGMVHDAQVQDQFFVDNKRPPTSLGDFAVAGMNYAPSPGPQDPMVAQGMPRALPGELAKSSGSMGRGR
jgi:hypothetical protein